MTLRKIADSPIPPANRLAVGDYVEILTGDPLRWQRFAGPLTPEAAVSEATRVAAIFGGARVYRIEDRQAACMAAS